MATRSLTIPGRLDQIEKICVLVGNAAEIAGLDSRTSYACQLAVSEACENIIKHGYGREDAGEITATTLTAPGELTVDLEDNAPPFNPGVKPTSSTWTEDNPPIGGLGLLIIHRAMDEVEYHRRGNRNCLRLRKRQRPAATDR